MTASRMKPLTSRRLTAGERGFAADMFGAGLDAGRVRIFAMPVWNRAFVAGPGLIVWPAATVPWDFAAPQVPLRTQAVFVHELTHVWQAQHGVRLLLAKLKAGDSDAAYAYDLAGGINAEGCAEVSPKGPKIGHDALFPEERMMNRISSGVTEADHLTRSVSARRFAVDPPESTQVGHDALVPEKGMKFRVSCRQAEAHHLPSGTNCPRRTEIPAECAQIRRDVGPDGGTGHVGTSGWPGCGFLGRARQHADSEASE